MRLEFIAIMSSRKVLDSLFSLQEQPLERFRNWTRLRRKAPNGWVDMTGDAFESPFGEECDDYADEGWWMVCRCVSIQRKQMPRLFRLCVWILRRVALGIAGLCANDSGYPPKVGLYQLSRTRKQEALPRINAQIDLRLIILSSERKLSIQCFGC